MAPLPPGTPAPDFSGTDIINGGTFTMSAHAGEVVCLLFIKYTCGNCAQEIPRIQQLWDQFRNHGVQMVAVISPYQGSTEAQEKTWLSGFGVTFPVIRDTNTSIWPLYSPQQISFSLLFVIDRDQIIQYNHSPFEPVEDTRNAILDAIYLRDPIDLGMVMDVSDSMNSLATAGDSKLVVMKQASKMVVDFLHDHGQNGDRMGLVWFTDDVSDYANAGGEKLLPLIANTADLKNQIDAKTTGICTAMGAGLQRAFDTLQTGMQKRFAIMLTDGMQNVDPMVRPVAGHFEIIDAPAEYHCNLTHASVPAHAGTNITSYNTRVHTIGVGITAAYSPLLSDIAAATGGFYLGTTDPATDLDLIYFVDLCNCMAGATPAVVYHATGTFVPEECQAINRFSINRTIRKFTAILSWPKSLPGNLAFWLRAPDGTVIDLHEKMKLYDTYAMATVYLPVEQDNKQLPRSGEWQMIVRGETESAAPYHAMVIGEDTGTHFELTVPHRVYEVGDILPLHVRLKEARSYLTNPSEVVLQKKTMRVPLSEMLAQYQFQPAQVRTTTGTIVRISHMVQLESKLTALATDPRFAEQLKPKVVTQSLREGTLPCAIAQNEMTFPVTLMEPGLHTFRVNVRFDTPKNGPISRVSLISVYISPGAADPEHSLVTTIPVGSGKTAGLTMLITPKNAAGQLIGPGRKAEIGLLIGDEKPKYAVEDLLDGTYRVTIEPGKTGFAKSRPVSLSIKDKVFWKGKTETLH